MEALISWISYCRGSTMGDAVKWNLQDACDVLTGLVSKNESNGQLNLHFFSTLVTSWTLLTCYHDKALQSSSHKTSSRGSSRAKDRGITKTRRRPSKWVFSECASLIKPSAPTSFTYKVSDWNSQSVRFTRCRTPTVPLESGKWVHLTGECVWASNAQ